MTEEWFYLSDGQYPKENENLAYTNPFRWRRING